MEHGVIRDGLSAGDKWLRRLEILFLLHLWNAEDAGQRARSLCIGVTVTETPKLLRLLVVCMITSSAVPVAKKASHRLA